MAADRSPELIAAALGIWKAGCAYVPLDPAYPAQRLAWMLADSGAELLLSTSKLEPIIGCAVPRIELDDPASLVGGSPPAHRAALQPEQLAYVIYTSGSTGLPKGVQIEHGGLANLARTVSEFAPLAPGERELLSSSPSFDASIHEIAAALAQGGTLVIPEQRHPLIGVELVELLDAERIALVLVPPSVLAQLPPRPLPALKTLVAAGERCAQVLADAWGCDRAFHNAYGPTEASVCASWHRCVPGAAGEPPIGRPLDGATLYVLDHRGEIAPVGVPGELWIGGIGVARGYLGRPELAAERFVAAEPLVGAPGRLYRTGDRARLRADGTFEFLGRRDDQHKIRGFRVELGEVEHAIRQHPGVQTAAVVVHGDGAAARLVAYAVPKRRPPSVELWPSVAEHLVYDEMLYLAMSHDEHRNQGYLAALRTHAPGKVVVDLGTGAEAILARLAVEAGARKVYAIELLPESYERARRAVEAHGLAGRIVLVHGDAATVELPEPADVCVSELVGAIGGSEGAAYLLNRARRLLHPDGAMIPIRSLTRIAAVEIPDEILAQPSFSPTAVFYARKIFAEVGHPFDLRLCLRGVEREALLSNTGVFEDLDFNGEVPLESEHEVTLTIEREGPLGGLLVWLVLFTTPGESIDVLDHQDSWIPVFLPLFDEVVRVAPGATLRLRIRRTLSDNGRNPNFHLRGELSFGDGRRVPIEHAVPHIAAAQGSSAFYRRLWSSFDATRASPNAATSGSTIAAQLRAFLRERLPSHLVPSEVIELAALPLTANGKLDRAALPRSAGDAREKPLVSEAEARVASIWRAVLGRDVAHDVTFFDAGGSSLLLVEVQAKLEAAIGTRVAMSELFAHPTIAAMTELASGRGRDLTPTQRRAEERAAMARLRGRAPGRARKVGP